MSVLEAVWRGVTYRGGIGHWAWLLFGPEVFNRLLFIYHSIFFRPFLVMLVFGVTYHALNGLRLILVDFWPGLMTRYHKGMWYVILVISLIATVINA